jgi:hypothetical protein
MAAGAAEELRTGDQGPQIGGPPACIWECRKPLSQKHKAALAEGKGAVMAHVVVRIIELLLAIGLAAAVTATFALAVITVVHGLHSAGRQR